MLPYIAYMDPMGTGVLFGTSPATSSAEVCLVWLGRRCKSCLVPAGTSSLWWNTAVVAVVGQNFWIFRPTVYYILYNMFYITIHILSHIFLTQRKGNMITIIVGSYLIPSSWGLLQRPQTLCHVSVSSVRCNFGGTSWIDPNFVGLKGSQPF